MSLEGALRFLLALLLMVMARGVVMAEPASWKVDELRAGMKGSGVTVLRGTTPERFEVEILGVLRNVQPRRDMIVARFSGLGLEKTGVMAGMSGSPVMIEEKLVGAVAYTWEFGTEPIGGITPFDQMVQFAERALPDKGKVALDDARWGRGRLMPIQTPLAVSGLSPVALALLREELVPLGMVPVQSGSANPDVQAAHAAEKFVPGSAMAVALVIGDIQVSAIGTVTSVSENRVFGFGHPFMDIGRCELPLLTAYIHTVMPLQSASFKIGSMISACGIVDADVSTGVRGQLGASASLVPLVVRVRGEAEERTMRAEVARVPALFRSLVLSAIASCVDGEGKAPVELTVTLAGRLEVEGREPIVFEDAYSGEKYQGPGGVVAALSPLAEQIDLLLHNDVAAARITGIEVAISALPGRTSARIAGARATKREYLAGETVKVDVDLEPYRSGEAELVKRTVSLRLPAQLPAGDYTVTLLAGPDDTMQTRRHREWMARPRTVEELDRAVRERQARGHRDLVARLETRASGVGYGAVELDRLPAGMVEVLASDRGGRVSRFPTSVVGVETTPWPLEGSKNVTIRVVARRSVSELPSRPGAAQGGP